MDEPKKNSLLIVDDVAANITVLMGLLGQDYEIRAAINGKSAIIAAEHYLPDLILLDILMPEMDGYEVLAALKKSEKTKDIPVIFITGLDDTINEERGLALGAVDYISKPFNATIVKLRVRNQIKIINQMQLIIEKELAEKSSRTRREFLSRMSHEIRTPMNAIMGMTALAKKESEPEKRDDMLDKISIASVHLLKLIDNVLDMSNIEDKKFSFFSSGFSFSKLMRTILNTIQQYTNQKQQSFSADIDPSIPDLIVSDEMRLSQVIQNLLFNAVKFTPERGSIQIKAFAREIKDDTLTMQIEVTDNGIGISKNRLESLFLPFEQIDGGMDRKYGGAGLGLSISKHIVHLMCGEIWVESELGKGSKFAFTMKAQIKSSEMKETEPVSFEGKTALLVEDVEINREIVIAMLEDTGLKIECAEDGRRALEIFTSAPDKYNVILMDINMPEMDGVTATRLIRELPEGTQVPIIAMTANVLISEVEAYIESGMNDHIGKPLDMEKLLMILAKHLQ